MSYAARVEGGTVPLDVRLYTDQAWDYVENEICESGHCITQPRDPTTRQNVRVLGRDAELLLIAAGTRPVNSARLIIDMGDTMVVAIARSGGPAMPGGPDLNPLIAPDELLRVMEQLRPYPE